MSHTEIRQAAEDLGFPAPRSHALDDRGEGLVRPLGRADERPTVHPTRPGSVAALTVCSVNYLHFARSLVASLRRHHPELALFVVVADWDGQEELELDGATMVAGSELGVAHFRYMTLKYSACDLCCALKPPGVRHLASLGFEKIVYLDSDIYVYAPMTRLLDALDEHQFLVTPHTIAPLPHPERFGERPSMADLASAGVYNAGLFGLRANEETAQFIATWENLVVGPGAFRKLQMEQNSFNWVTCFLDDVHVLRDTAYNVAYWNLHDRSLRYTGLDDADEPGWEVDGKPLVAFHFSGSSFDTPSRLSRFDSRSSLYLLPSVARLIEQYTAELARFGAFEMRERDYRYDRFPSGIEIDDRMRHCFREYETHLWRDIDPWTEEGEAYFCRALLLPGPGSYLVPILVWEIFSERPDLRSAYQNTETNPAAIIRWFGQHGSKEYQYPQLVDLHRPTVPKLESVEALGELRAKMPSAFEGLESPMGKDKRQLVRKLEQAGRVEEASRILDLSYEHIDLSLVYLARSLVNERTDLKLAHPDFLFDDAEALAAWFDEFGTTGHFLPAELAARFLERAQGRSVARIFSFVNRNWALMEAFPLAFVGENKEAFARSLLDILPGGPEFDLDDIVMYLWVMEEKPWMGVPLTLELLVNTHRMPSPLVTAGQDALLAPVLHRDPRFGDALLAYRDEHSVDRNHLDALHALPRLRPVSVLEGRRHPALGNRRNGKTAHPAAAQKQGVNFFGYFKSPIGLGNLSRGLATALESNRVPVQRNLVGNVAMDRDLAPGHFVRQYRHAYDVNLFASYPHLHDRLRSMYPRWIWNDRRNVVYLAWEQRDGSPYWPEVFEGFDQVWALSSFAAEGLSRWMEREVMALPCVVDYDRFPAAVEKQAVGLDPDRFVFLYVFDANSSIERKNPEAAIDAFARAFRPGEPVQLVLKVSNHYRLEHQRRLAEMKHRAAATGLEILFLLENLEHDDLLRFVSAADCYVSLHRAEGFGYTCAEAMGYGLPVIATNYSGNLDFMDRDNSFLVDFEEKTVEVPDGPFQRGSIWAEPSVEHAAQLMRQVVDDSSLAAARGKQAAVDVRRILSAERIGAVAARALYGDDGEGE